MLKYLIQGFMIGVAYVAPIGMQNLYVINTAISKGKARAYQVALITSFFDISLALACFLGMGYLMEKYQILKMIVLLVGSIAVCYIGISLIRSKDEGRQKVDTNMTIIQVIASCFMVTWLNPQALIDGTLLLGGFRASLPYNFANAFILGVCLASITWFTTLTTVVTIFRSNFSAKVIKYINIVCGSVLVYYGIKLGYNFIKLVL